jgi:hypothetical protein
VSTDAESPYDLRPLLASSSGHPRARKAVHRAIGTPQSRTQPAPGPAFDRFALTIASMFKRPRTPIVELGYTTHMRIQRQLSRGRALKGIAEAKRAIEAVGGRGPYTIVAGEKFAAQLNEDVANG